jgi:hypothetical protein
MPPISLIRGIACAFLDSWDVYAWEHRAEGQMTHPKWAPEPQHINVREDYELRYWSERFGVPKDDIEAAVKRVGPRVEDVAQEVSLLYA